MWKSVVALLAICLSAGCDHDGAWPAVELGQEAAGEAVRVIYDTDVGDDVDDALALAMLHALRARGDCELIGVSVSKPNFYASAYVDLVNTFYDRRNVPIGLSRVGSLVGPGPYVGIIATDLTDGLLTYPRRLLEEGQVPESVEMLRSLLAAQPDGSVVIVQVGYATNMSRLLDSAPDEHSELSGYELVEKKVKLLSMMSGYFGTDLTGFAEHNIRIDIPAAQNVFANWPTPIVVSGWEVGRGILYPARSIMEDFDYVNRHPIREAYELWNLMPYDRPTYDLTSAIYAVWPERDLFSLSAPGRVIVDPDGITTFQVDPIGRHHYLIVDDAQRARLSEIFQLLVSEPPHG